MPKGAEKLLKEMQDKLFDMVKEEENIDFIRMEDEFSIESEKVLDGNPIKNKIIIRKWHQLDLTREDVKNLREKLFCATGSQQSIHNILFLDEIPAVACGDPALAYGDYIGEREETIFDWTLLGDQGNKDHLVLAIRPSTSSFSGGPGFQVKAPASGPGSVTCHLNRPYRYSKEVKRLVDFLITHQTYQYDVNLDTRAR